MEPVTNPDFKPGLRVSVIGLPAPKEWRTERGLEIFGPKSFGFDVAYQPIENRYAK